MKAKNPFSEGLINGEGHCFSPKYFAFVGAIKGDLADRIQTRFDLDIPFWPAYVLHYYKEIWIHPSYRWLELWDYLGLE
jgi:hypothetical protein